MAKRLVFKFDEQLVFDQFKYLIDQSIPSLVQQLNESVNRSGGNVDLSVAFDEAKMEYNMLSKSANKGVVFVISDDEVGIKAINYSDIPTGTKYVLYTPNGYMLKIRYVGGVDQSLVYLKGGPGDIKPQIVEYEEQQALAEAERAKKDVTSSADNNAPDNVPDNNDAPAGVDNSNK